MTASLCCSSTVVVRLGGAETRPTAAARAVPLAVARQPRASVMLGSRQSRASVLRTAPQRNAMLGAPSRGGAVAAMKMGEGYCSTTLTTWLFQKEREQVIDNELTVVLSSIATACKQISSLVQRAGISNMTGLAGETNVQVLWRMCVGCAAVPDTKRLTSGPG